MGIRQRCWRWARLLVAGGVTLQLTGCLSDQQVTSILTAAITTGLTTLISQFLVSSAGA